MASTPIQLPSALLPGWGQRDWYRNVGWLQPKYDHPMLRNIIHWFPCMGQWYGGSHVNSIMSEELAQPITPRELYNNSHTDTASEAARPRYQNGFLYFPGGSSANGANIRTGVNSFLGLTSMSICLELVFIGTNAYYAANHIWQHCRSNYSNSYWRLSFGSSSNANVYFTNKDPTYVTETIDTTAFGLVARRCYRVGLSYQSESSEGAADGKIYLVVDGELAGSTTTGVTVSIGAYDPEAIGGGTYSQTQNSHAYYRNIMGFRRALAVEELRQWTLDPMCVFEAHPATLYSFPSTISSSGLSIPVAMASYRRHHLGAMH